MFQIAIVAAVLVAPCEGRQDAMAVGGQLLRECGAVHAGALSGSVSEPMDIATAAIERCGQEIAFVVAAASECRGDGYARLFESRLRKRFADQIVAEVVSRRAR